jgi:hypothetical protein
MHGTRFPIDPREALDLVGLTQIVASSDDQTGLIECRLVLSGSSQALRSCFSFGTYRTKSTGGADVNNSPHSDSCGKDADYCVLRRTERPMGRMLTSISEPCGRQFSGAKGDVARV